MVNDDGALDRMQGRVNLCIMVHHCYAMSDTIGIDLLLHCI